MPFLGFPIQVTVKQTSLHEGQVFGALCTSWQKYVAEETIIIPKNLNYRHFEGMLPAKQAQISLDIDGTTLMAQ